MNAVAFAAQSFHDHGGRRFECRECRRLLLTVDELQDGDRCEMCWERAADRAAAAAGSHMFGFDRPGEQMLEPFCACGHVVSNCDGSRRGCKSGAAR